MSYVKIGKTKIKNVKFAISNDEQARGLMGVDWEPPVMVFPYKKAEIKKFWMKNTKIPLDIIFCKDGKVIYIGVGRPFVEDKLIGPNYPSDLVIETPGGFCSYNKIEIGDPIKIKLGKKILRRIINSKKENDGE